MGSISSSETRSHLPLRVTVPSQASVRNKHNLGQTEYGTVHVYKPLKISGHTCISATISLLCPNLQTIAKVDSLWPFRKKRRAINNHTLYISIVRKCLFGLFLWRRQTIRQCNVSDHTQYMPEEVKLFPVVKGSPKRQ
jgi:hypothetical protein